MEELLERLAEITPVVVETAVAEAPGPVATETTPAASTSTVTVGSGSGDSSFGEPAAADDGPAVASALNADARNSHETLSVAGAGNSRQEGEAASAGAIADLGNSMVLSDTVADAIQGTLLFGFHKFGAFNF